LKSSNGSNKARTHKRVRVFRVYPYVAGASTAKPGHALYRQPQQGFGRIDNPEHYLALYAAASPRISLAEVFAAQPAPWNDTTLFRADGRPYHIAEIQMADEVPLCNLDNPRALLQRNLIPSSIVSKDRQRTQAWALEIFQEERWRGVSWWSFYDPDTPAFGVWDVTNAAVLSTEAVRFDSDAFVAAAKLLGREIQTY